LIKQNVRHGFSLNKQRCYCTCTRYYRYFCNWLQRQ